MTVHEEIHQAAETLHAQAAAAEHGDGVALMDPTIGRELANLLAGAASWSRHGEDRSHAGQSFVTAALEVARAINNAGGSRE